MPDQPLTTLSRRDAGLAAAVAVIWGVNFVVIRVGLDSYPPMLLVALRFALVAGVGVWLVPKPDISTKSLIAIGAAIGIGQFGFLFVAIDRGMTAGLAAVVLQAQAAFTLLFAAVLLGERASRRQLTGVAISAVGLAVLGVDVFQRLSLVGFGLTLCGAASWGLGNIATRSAGRANGLAVIVWASLVPPIPMLGASLVFEGPGRISEAMGSVDIGGVGAIIYLAFAATFLGFGTWSSLMAKYEASTVAPFSLMVPPVGLVAAWLFLGEKPAVLSILGTVIVLAGLAYPLSNRNREQRNRGSDPPSRIPLSDPGA